MTRRLPASSLAVAVALCSAATAHAAPWSFELPEGYTEVAGAGEQQAAAIRALSRTVSIDVQVYAPADHSVQLTRSTWLQKPDHKPTRRSLEATDRNLVSGGALIDAKHISDTRYFVGDQLVAESIDEKDGVRIRQRRLYSADTSHIVHVLTISCAATIGTAMPDCERAQQTMQLTLPNQLALVEGDDDDDDAAEIFVRLAALVLVALAVALFFRYRHRTA